MPLRHQSSDFCRQKYTGAKNKIATPAQALNSSDAATLGQLSQGDASNYYFNALVSFWEAMAGLLANRGTWATVKLYYSAFYASRALLLSGKYCIFYIDTTPYSILISTGSIPKKGKGHTHGYVLDSIESVANSICPEIFGQSIGVTNSTSPLKWLSGLRERANYKDAKFLEPMIQEELVYACTVGIRKCLLAYMHDNKAYLYDEKHAAICLPMLLLKKNWATGFVTLTQDDKNYLTHTFANKQLPVQQFLTWLNAP